MKKTVNTERTDVNLADKLYISVHVCVRGITEGEENIDDASIVCV